jgi:hypothetical protein
LKFAPLRRVAPAQTLPRGERGPRLATDLQPRPVPQSTPPKPKPASAGFVFPKTEYWDQLPSLSSESNAKTPRREFCAGAFLMDFSRGILRSAYTAKYPIPASGRPALRLPTPSDRDVKNALENIERMERGKIVTHYNYLLEGFLVRELISQRRQPPLNMIVELRWAPVRHTGFKSKWQ